MMAELAELKTSPSKYATIGGAVLVIISTTGAILKAIAELIEPTGQIVRAIVLVVKALGLSRPMAWLAIAGLGAFGSWLFWLGAKTSRLLRPQKLTHRPDDPQHVRGRDK